MLIQHTSLLKYYPKRIISLVPSQTELLFDLGLTDTVVGITKFCVHPVEWRKIKTVVGGTKKLQIQKIKAINPDLIIANKEENNKDEIELLAEEFPVWLTDVDSLENALMMINDVGVLTGYQNSAAKMIAEIQNRFKQIHPLKRKLNTCYFIWKNPYMTAGVDTFIHAMMNCCGLNNIVATEKRYPVISIEELKAKNCELLLLSTEPFPFNQNDVEELQAQLPGTKIVLVDGEYFSWYGSRLLNAPIYFNSVIDQLRSMTRTGY